MSKLVKKINELNKNTIERNAMYEFTTESTWWLFGSLHRRGVLWSHNKLISGMYYSYEQLTPIIADNLGSTGSSL